MLPRRAIYSGVGMCLFGGKATVFLGFISMPMSASSRWGKGTTSSTSAVASIMPMLIDVVQVGERPDTSRLELFFGLLQYRQERHAKQRRSDGVLHSAGEVDISPFSRVHLELHKSR